MLPAAEAGRDSTVEAVLRQARAALGRSSTLEAQLLLGRVLQRPRSWLLAHGEFELSAGQLADYRSAFSRLTAGEPLPYLLGEWEFYGRSFLVGPGVLIPRPETELMVEWALRLGRRARRVLDLGTGSGCLAVTLAVELPESRVVAGDLSPAALRTARANARRHAVSDQIHWLAADLFGPLAGQFDLVCANLPYLPTDRLAGLEAARREPRLALDGGRDGTRLIRSALRQLPRALAPQGVAMFEIDPEQAHRLRRLAQSQFPGAAVGTVRDLAGLDRMIVIQNG